MEDSKSAKGQQTTGNDAIIKKVIEFLQILMPLTLAKRLVAMILLAAGVSVPRVTELSGLCDRSTRGLLKAMGEEDVGSLLTIKRGSGKRAKPSDLRGRFFRRLRKTIIIPASR